MEGNSDFRPALARERLMELHGVHVEKEALREWMTTAEIWLTRAKGLPNNRLGAAPAIIQTAQSERDPIHLDSQKLTLR
jgi:hypothetical protein